MTNVVTGSGGYEVSSIYMREFPNLSGKCPACGHDAKITEKKHRGELDDIFITMNSIRCLKTKCIDCAFFGKNRCQYNIIYQILVDLKCGVGKVDI
jgi:hypothetical protein